MDRIEIQSFSKDIHIILSLDLSEFVFICKSSMESRLRSSLGQDWQIKFHSGNLGSVNDGTENSHKNIYRDTNVTDVDQTFTSFVIL